jgi:hypothetical protein
MKGVPMRHAIAFLFAVFFVAIPGIAQSKIEVDDLAHHPSEADFPSGGQPSLHIRSAEIHIVGSDENKIAVHVSRREGGNFTDMKARFERSDNSGELHVSGGTHNDLTITVHVPKICNLFVRIAAGDVEVHSSVLRFCAEVAGSPNRS